MGVAQAKVPLAVLCGIIGFALGGAAGVLGMTAFGYHWSPEKQEGGTPPGGGPPGMGGGPGGGGRPGGFPGGPGMPNIPGFGQPDAKSQLAQLVVALDRLTGQPLTLTLSDAQKAKVLEQVKGLAKEKELSEEDAKKKLGELMTDLQGHAATLKAAGFDPGQAPRPPVPVANPFTEEENKKHLEDLEKRLAKPGA
jgi:hypothetical protein